MQQILRYDSLLKKTDQQCDCNAYEMLKPNKKAISWGITIDVTSKTGTSTDTYKSMNSTVCRSVKTPTSTLVGLKVNNDDNKSKSQEPQI